MENPNRNHIADLHELMGILDKRLPKLADVDKPSAIRPELNKHAEVCNADNQSREHRAGFELIHRRHVASKRDRVLKLSTVSKREL
jgi:hypothetical protein